jgi:hypothetical protein
MDPRLADLTTADLMEYLRENPQTYHAITNTDPRVQLMERIHAAPGGEEDIAALVRKHKDKFPPNARIPIDVKEQAREAAAAAIKDDLQAIKDLRAETEKERKEQRLKGFRAEMIEAGAEEADVEKIEQFMLDNEIGPKSVKLAVERYYEVTAPAEPTGTSGLPWHPTNTDQEFLTKLAAAPIDADLDQIAAPWYEKTFQDVVKGQGRGARAGAR